MKTRIANLMSVVLFVFVLGFALISCYETHYYNHYHHHTREWYDRHHQAPPAGVRWDVDVDVHR